MGNIIERAIILALSGQHSTIRTIRNELHMEGFTHRELSSLSGRELQRQLRALMVQSSTSPTTLEESLLAGVALSVRRP
jgi:ABC-type Mn2+/Zn2+ transport system ATPase subunit